MYRKDKQQTGLKSPQQSSQRSLDSTIVYRPIDELKPDPANPRRHSKQQIRQIANSVEAFGFNVPILIDRDDNVICGHGRLAACCELGVTEAPTLCLDHLTPEQARAFRIADNRLTEIAVWDDRLLAQQLKDLALLDLDFSIEATGFEMGEIDLRIRSLEDLPETDDDPADLLPEMPAGLPISKLEDIWVLGRHRLLCGTALASAAFAALMGDERATMIITDPPYNVPIDGHASGLGAIHHRPFPMASGEMDAAEFTAFLRQAFRNLAAFSVDGSLHYICMDWRHIGELLTAGRDVYHELKNLCVWVKDNGGMGSLYRSQHEFVFVFKYGPKRAPQQRPARAVRTQPQQRVELPGGQFLLPSRRGGQSLGAASSREAGGDGCRCNPRLLGPRRHRARRLSRQRHDPDRRRAHRPPLLRFGARPGLCRHGRPPLAGADRRHRLSCDERPQL
jgi:ParB-like nuclease domain